MEHAFANGARERARVASAERLRLELPDRMPRSGGWIALAHGRIVPLAFPDTFLWLSRGWIALYYYPNPNTRDPDWVTAEPTIVIMVRVRRNSAE